MPVTRRHFLIGGAGALAASVVATGCSPEVTGTSQTGSFTSVFRHRKVGWQIVRPDGHEKDRLPVLIALHGRGGDHSDAFAGSLHLDHVLADTVQGGATPFAIASVDGGDAEYWHPRAATDPAGMVVHEFLPLLAEHGLAVDRIGLIGWSMGGYGALYLGTVLGRGRIAALVAESPAIWHTAAQRVSGSFDSDADFDRHSILPRVDRLRGIATRIDCGSGDGFRYITTELRSMLSPTPAGGIEAGGHDSDYWRSQAPAQLRFVARHLA